MLLQPFLPLLHSLFTVISLLLQHHRTFALLHPRPVNTRSRFDLNLSWISSSIIGTQKSVANPSRLVRRRHCLYSLLCRNRQHRPDHNMFDHQHPEPEISHDSPQPVWDPVAQIYVSGKLPENANVRQMLDHNDGVLRLFGYGSLCWNPGGAATDESVLTHASVTTCTGYCVGYRRVWAQKSTDHRGTPYFPGLVCTLLTDAEYRSFQHDSTTTNNSQYETSLTEGVLYVIPPALVERCLEELDFREKGVSVLCVCFHFFGNFFRQNCNVPDIRLCLIFYRLIFLDMNRATPVT